MALRAELHEAAILAAVKAYMKASHLDEELVPPEHMATFHPCGSNAVRAAAIAVLEFMGLRDAGACFECSHGHWCEGCGEPIDHWRDSVGIVCDGCREAATPTY